MTPTRSLLLLEGAGSTSALAERVVRLGASPVRAKTPEEALRLVEDPRFRFGAALAPVDFPVTDLGAALRELAARSSAGRLAFVVVGRAPEAKLVASLRDAGVELALWEPFDDRMLRFVLNCALGERPLGAARREPRVPTDWTARVFVGGREKHAEVYSLSARGAFLETPRPAVRGAALTLELPLPGGPMLLEGRVIFANVPGNLERANLPYGMGVAFTDLSPQSSEAIRRCVEEKARRFTI